MSQTASENWTYILHPVTDDYLIQAIQTKVEVGQKITIEWDAEGITVSAPHNRWVWRCLGAGLDGNAGGYAGIMQSQISEKGSETHEVTTAGNILFGGYTIGLTQNNSVMMHSYKIRIENPEGSAS